MGGRNGRMGRTDRVKWDAGFVFEAPRTCYMLTLTIILGVAAIYVSLFLSLDHCLA
jgi:hypothetical protein